ncbi:MAG: aldehyde dehydrogenase EutE [Candidatus Sumerlaeia bacterium]
MQIDEGVIRSVVQEVLDALERTGAAGSVGPTIITPGSAPKGPLPPGVFENVDDAVAAARRAHEQLIGLTLERRKEIIAALRRAGLTHAAELARRTVEETKLGRVEDKIAKFKVVAEKTPGPEILEPRAVTGDHGLTVTELAPFGVCVAVTPVTHPVPTLLNNAISMVSAGNGVVFNAHPASKGVFADAIGLFNRAIQDAGGPPNLLTCVKEPTIETGQALFHHKGVNLILVTGGPGVVKEALRAPKRAICAGPGNPPVVVDETADISRAARDIIVGGSFDNNVLCTAEKEIFVVGSVADQLIHEMLQRGCVQLTPVQIDALARVAFDHTDGGHPRVSRDLVGRCADVLGRAIGLEVPPSTRLLIGETSFDHVFVQGEQLMPFMPIVRVRDVHEAIDKAIAAEHGFRHTCMIHSKNIEHMHIFAKRANCSIFVKNGPNLAGLGAGGEGYTSFSIAGTTGEGITTARTFSRERRCALVDYFRIV